MQQPHPGQYGAPAGGPLGPPQPPPGCPPGLQYLTMVDQLLVKQKVAGRLNSSAAAARLGRDLGSRHGFRDGEQVQGVQFDGAAGLLRQGGHGLPHTTMLRSHPTLRHEDI